MVTQTNPVVIRDLSEINWLTQSTSDEPWPVCSLDISVIFIVCSSAVVLWLEWVHSQCGWSWYVTSPRRNQDVRNGERGQVLSGQKSVHIVIRVPSVFMSTVYHQGTLYVHVQHNSCKTFIGDAWNAFLSAHDLPFIFSLAMVWSPTPLW